jgi:PAS domain S-box-containing protein
MNINESPLKRQVIAAAAVGMAVLINLTLRRWSGPFLFPAFLIAVLFSSRYGGMGPGLTAAGLSLAARTLLLITSEELHLTLTALLLWLVMFTAVEVLIVCVVVARRQDEAAFKYTERRFRLVADTLPQLVWAARPDGWITFMNRHWYEITGSAPDRGLGYGWIDTIHPEDRQLTLDRWHAAVRSGTTYEDEYRIRCADGNYRWFLGRGLPSKDTTDRIVEWYGTCTDIDKQKQTASALAEATRAKDNFLAVLSHELRTPLAPVLMGISALTRPGKVCPSCYPILAMIIDNVQLEARLIDDLLDISRITRGQMEYRFQITDLHTLIEHAVEICKPEIIANEHQLRLDLAASQHYVEGDPARLQQVIWNLVTNGVKYTPRGGQIAVGTTSHGSDYIKVTISDNGEGIEPKDMPRLFQSFERGYEASFSHTRGLGLGLALTRSIVEAHKGTIEATSEGRGKGCTFIILLKTARPTAIVRAQSLSENQTTRSLKILLAEDNAATGDITANVLRQKGHDVTIATCLRRALEEAGNGFDVVISDIDLGDGSGLELIRHIRARRDIPGIAISGYATEEDVRQSLQAGFTIHLAKPITFATLESAILQVTAA